MIDTNQQIAQNTSIYNIDYNRIAIWDLPIKWRKVINVEWLKILLTPVIRLHQEFLAFKTASNYKLSHNSQVVLLEKMLNDNFDKVNRAIEIRNVAVKEPVWFYEPQDDKPVYFYEPADDKSVYFYEPTDLDAATEDFLVVVPATLRPGGTQANAQFETAMKTQINYYKLYSKNYKIVYG